MARKQLNVSGGNIKKFLTSIEKKKLEGANTLVEYVKLVIETDEGEWEYEIFSDDRAPELGQIEAEINNSLTQAQIDFSKVGIKEFKERSYLFIEVKGHLNKQYTGTKQK